MVSNCAFYDYYIRLFQLSERLEQLAGDVGTARDGLQLRSEIEQLMKDLYGQIQRFNRECANLAKVVDPADVRGREGEGGEGKGQRSGRR